MDQTVTLFNGKKVRITCEDSKAVSVINEIMLKPFEEDMKAAWLSNDQSEAKAKGYMNYVGSLMLKKPLEHDIISDRSLRRIASKEVCVADVTKPPQVEFKKIKKIEKQETRFEKIERIKKSNPGCKMISCRVETDGTFHHKGVKYKITHDDYKPKKEKGYGDFYKFDTVYVVESADLKFFDQDLNKIDMSKIKLEQ